MRAQIGDAIVLESERAAQQGRRGVIEEILQEDPPRYRVHWDDGRTTILVPGAGVAMIEKARKRKGASAT